MSWEEPPAATPRTGRLVVAMAAVALIVAGVVAANVLPDRTTALTIVPTEDPAATPDDAATGLGPEAIAPIRRSTEVTGAGELLPDTALTIVAADFNARLQLVDVATGGVERVQLLDRPIRRRPDSVQIVGDSTIVDVAGLVVGLADGDERATILARNRRSIASTDTASVWVYEGVIGGAGGVASRLGLDGTVLDEVELATLARPLAGTAAGLVVAAPGTVSWIDVDGARRQIARGHALASDGLRLARLECSGVQACSVVTGTLDDPDQVRTQLGPRDVPAGQFDDVSTGRFSPDGRWLALPIVSAGRTFGFESTGVVVLDTTLGAEALRIDGSALTQPTTPVAWSPDSRWLVTSTGTGLRAWSTAAFGVTDLPVRLAPTYALAAR